MSGSTRPFVQAAELPTTSKRPGSAGVASDRLTHELTPGPQSPLTNQAR